MKNHEWVDGKLLQTNKKYSRSIKRNLHNRLAKELRQDPEYRIHIKPLDVRFSVCKVNNYSGIDLTRPFCFIGTTDEENSLVCPEETVPEHTIERDDGWRGFRITGQLDFSLIGILARISLFFIFIEFLSFRGCQFQQFQTWYR